MRFLLRGSILADGVRGAGGTFMSGMHTYLMKLGPEMLGSAYAKPIDQRIATALPVLSVRLRLQDVAQLMSDTLAPSLRADSQRPLHFINIGGGPAIDSLNALILLNQQPRLLAHRQVIVEVLDRDDAGPAFGKAAMAAVSEPGGPLQGVSMALHHVRYDWAHAENLTPVLGAAHERGALVICSSEGGLFDYGSDEEIEANLRALRAWGEVIAVAGSVTRADEPTRRLHQTSTAAVRLRGLDNFRALVQSAGWQVACAIERPFSDQFVLS